MKKIIASGAVLLMAGCMSIRPSSGLSVEDLNNQMDVTRMLIGTQSEAHIILDSTITVLTRRGLYDPNGNAADNNEKRIRLHDLIVNMLNDGKKSAEIIRFFEEAPL